MDAESQYVEELKAEIERLRVFETEVNTRTWNEMVLENELYKARKLITELANELERRIDWSVNPLRGDLLQRAREATK